VKIIVGVADMKISNDKEDVLITYALGSCLGITIYDPVVHVGGLLHVMLPVSSVDPVKAKTNPSMFVDTGVPKLFTDSYKLGAKKERLIVKVAGGASTNSDIDEDFFKIGQRNFVLLRKVLWKNGVLLKAHDVGLNHSRTMSLEMNTGRVVIKITGNSENEL
jgi:chemotaxis protein CheD